MANNGISNLRNVVPLGVLKDSIFPAKSDKEIIYLYYRSNGDLYKYSTVDNIEVNLTNTNAYNNTVLFYTGKEADVSGLDITKFTSETIEVSTAVYDYEYVQEETRYIHILVPIVYNLHSIFIDDVVNTSQFALKGIYQTKDGLTYNIYRTSTLVSLASSAKITLVLESITDSDLDTLAAHIQDTSNPHAVTKAQIGLPNVDNTADIDKPVSTPTQEAITAVKTYADNTLARKDTLDSVSLELFNHTKATNPHSITKSTINLGNVDNTSDKDKPISTAANNKFTEVENKLNNKADLLAFNELKSDTENHIANTNNPHHVTAAQLGLDELSKIFFRQVGYADEVIDLYIRRGTEEELKSIPIVNRQLLFATDTRTIYFDHCNIREGYAGGQGIDIVSDSDANLLVTSPVYYLVGTKENVPDVLKRSDLSYLLFLSEDNVKTTTDPSDPTCVTSVSTAIQTIVIGHKIWTRKQNEDDTWTDWELQDIYANNVNINNKVDELDERLTQQIEDIHTELNEDFVRSLQVREIKCVSVLPNPMERDVLYIQFMNDFLGIDYMRIKGIDEEPVDFVHYFMVS